MLTTDEVSFFARNGYLRVPDMVSAQDCEELIEETWKLLPPTWSRNEPDTWTGEVTDSCHRSSIAFRGGHVKFQKKTYPAREIYARVFGPSGKLGQVAHALIGFQLGPMRQRGLYAIVPVDPATPLHPPAHHVESHAAQVIALAYLAEVAPGGGGLMVWPGSHRDLYPAMGSKLDYVATPRSKQVYDAWARLEPVEVPGNRGDAVLIHHRLIHAPSLNRSRRLRFAYLCDYFREDFRSLCAQTPDDGLWADWPGVAALPRPLLAQGPDVQLTEAKRYSLPSSRDARDRSVINKSDASKIARLRQPGDCWIVLSDSEAGNEDNVLDPRGGDIAGRGLRLLVNGKPVNSESRNDFVARLPSVDGHAHIEVRHAPCRLWLKVVRISLPFVGGSKLVYRVELAAGARRNLDLVI